MKKIIYLLFITVLISGVTLNAINQANHVSHGKQRMVEILSYSDVLEIVFDYLDVQNEEVDSIYIELINEQYELSFNVESITYNFKIHSTTGDILETNQVNK